MQSLLRVEMGDQMRDREHGLATVKQCLPCDAIGRPHVTIWTVEYSLKTTIETRDPGRLKGPRARSSAAEIPHITPLRDLESLCSVPRRVAELRSWRHGLQYSILVGESGVTFPDRHRQCASLPFCLLPCWPPSLAGESQPSTG